MITKFKIFENFNELDPYGEEDWNEPIEFKYGDKVRVLPKLQEYIDSGEWPEKFNRFIDEIAFVTNPHWKENKCVLKFLRIDRVGNGNYIIPLNCVEKIQNTNESFNELDPYGEEDWNEWNEPELLPNGTKIRILPRIRHYIDNLTWNKDFLNHVGKINVIDNYRYHRGHHCYVIPRFPNDKANVISYFLPIDCVEKIVD